MMFHFSGSNAEPRYSIDDFPETSFTCDDKPQDGLYADVETQCHVFHLCRTISGVLTLESSFVCPPGTVFNQPEGNCDTTKEVDCALYSAPEHTFRKTSGHKNQGSKVRTKRQSNVQAPKPKYSAFKLKKNTNFKKLAALNNKKLRLKRDASTVKETIDYYDYVDDNYEAHVSKPINIPEIVPSDKDHTKQPNTNIASVEDYDNESPAVISEKKAKEVVNSQKREEVSPGYPILEKEILPPRETPLTGNPFTTESSAVPDIAVLDNIPGKKEPLVEYIYDYEYEDELIAATSTTTTTTSAPIYNYKSETETEDTNDRKIGTESSPPKTDNSNQNFTLTVILPTFTESNEKYITTTPSTKADIDQDLNKRTKNQIEVTTPLPKVDSSTLSTEYEYEYYYDDEYDESNSTNKPEIISKELLPPKINIPEAELRSTTVTSVKELNDHYVPREGTAQRNSEHEQTERINESNDNLAYNPQKSTTKPASTFKSTTEFSTHTLPSRDEAHHSPMKSQTDHNVPTAEEINDSLTPPVKYGIPFRKDALSKEELDHSVKTTGFNLPSREEINYPVKVNHRAPTRKEFPSNIVSLREENNFAEIPAIRQNAPLSKEDNEYPTKSAIKHSSSRVTDLNTQFTPSGEENSYSGKSTTEYFTHRTRDETNYPQKSTLRHNTSTRKRVESTVPAAFSRGVSDLEVKTTTEYKVPSSKEDIFVPVRLTTEHPAPFRIHIAVPEENIDTLINPTKKQNTSSAENFKINEYPPDIVTPESRLVQTDLFPDLFETTNPTFLQGLDRKSADTRNQYSSRENSKVDDKDDITLSSLTTQLHKQSPIIPGLETTTAKSYSEGSEKNTDHFRSEVPYTESTTSFELPNYDTTIATTAEPPEETTASIFTSTKHTQATSYPSRRLPSRRFRLTSTTTSVPLDDIAEQATVITTSPAPTTTTIPSLFRPSKQRQVFRNRYATPSPPAVVIQSREKPSPRRPANQRSPNENSISSNKEAKNGKSHRFTVQSSEKPEVEITPRGYRPRPEKEVRPRIHSRRRNKSTTTVAPSLVVDDPTISDQDASSQNTVSSIQSSEFSVTHEASTVPYFKQSTYSDHHEFKTELPAVIAELEGDSYLNREELYQSTIPTEATNLPTSINLESSVTTAEDNRSTSTNYQNLIDTSLSTFKSNDSTGKDYNLTQQGITSDHVLSRNDIATPLPETTTSIATPNENTPLPSHLGYTLSSVNSQPSVASNDDHVTENGPFVCTGKELHQYHPDPHDCRMFHYCSPGFHSRQVLDFRFTCENGTAFKADTQKCESEDLVPGCEHQES